VAHLKSEIWDLRLEIGYLISEISYLRFEIVLDFGFEILDLKYYSPA